MRAAYEALYARYEASIEATKDVGLLKRLNASQASVDGILTKDTQYRLKASTALFQALLTQINSTNADLRKLKEEIAAIGTDVATAGDILAAIDKVLSLVPAI